MSELLIGSHVGMSGKEMMLASVKEAIGYGANTFMIYTGAPQNTRRKALEELNIDAALALCSESNIKDIVIHAPYIINLANTVKEDMFGFATDFLYNEIIRSEAMGSNVMVLHPGSHVGAGVDAGIAQIIKGLNIVLEEKHEVNIALETMAGKGSEIGRSFEELARIYDGVVHNDRLRVCFDTCHTNDAGYDVKNDFDGVIEEFDKIIGADQIAVFHINDSKNPLGAAKDRHENIGFGTIGFDALSYIVHHERFADIPKILETPYVVDEEKKTHPPYKYEIKMLKDNKFDENVLDAIINEL